MERVYIVNGKRTPIGSLMGQFKDVSGIQLASFTVKELLKETQIDPNIISEIIYGNVLAAGQKQSPARQISLYSDLPPNIPCWNLNKLCASGMKAIMIGSLNIMARQTQVALVGGFESMTNAPGLILNYRKGTKFGHGEIKDHILHDGLEDAFQNKLMGHFAEVTAHKFNITRQMQDDYCIRSYENALYASNNGTFEKEIVPISTKKGIISTDEEPKNLRKDKIPKLKPVFGHDGLDGTITGANASKINDGACSLLLASQESVNKYKLKPMAEIISFADAELAPELFNETPILAMKMAIEKANLKISDIDYFEINEAFSVTPLLASQELKIPLKKININGGAVSMGHPVGMSGARILLHLANILTQKNAKYGCASICNGGGGACAVVIQRCQQIII